MAFRWPWAKPEERDLSREDIPWSTGDDALSTGSVEGALALSPVFASVRIIAHGLSTLPIDVHRRQGRRQEQIDPPPLLSDPTLFGTDVQWIQRIVTSMLTRGEATGVITSWDPMGFPSRVEWVNPQDVSIDDDRALTRPRWRFLGQPIAPWTGRGSLGQLIVIPWLTLPGFVRGLSPIAAFMTTFEHGRYMQKFGRDYFKHGSVPTSVLEGEDESRDLTPHEARILKARFKAAAANREPVVLAGYKYRAITVPPEESQFVETARLNATQIAALYGVEPEDVGGETGGPLNYATPHLRAMATAQKALRPNAVIIERALSTLLPDGQFCRFNLDAYARADTQTRYRSHSIALNPTSGWMDKGEVREIEDLPPRDTDPDPKPARPEGDT